MLQLTIQGKFRDTLIYKSRVTGEQKIEYRDWQKIKYKILLSI
jgi:hypothetical protein